MLFACSRTSAWSRATIEFLYRTRSLVFCSVKAAYHSTCVSVRQKNEPFRRLINPLVAPGTSSGINSVQLSRRVSMAFDTMPHRMVWVDLEMTGLDIRKDQIIEMACIITDSDLNILAEGPNLIINQPDELLEGMSDWCKEHHGKSGLTQAVRDSKITLEQAEYEFLSFVRQHTPPGQCPLAGNSVHADKRFLDKYMPQFMYHLHYRIIDVSTIKELCKRWYPEDYKTVPHKKAAHSFSASEPLMTSWRAFKSCSTTEPTSSKQLLKRRSARL
ncbi:small fragment nuclease isoform X2 [Anabas testudineus]|uniref:small fragment nuclease isoform X2 n=1 Tax=Anabas testudineus TaxID=64144 RepID=UPI000E45C01D|nr:small fragment nuclease isoform X2 [Anabas testudineus]XP_026228274.1 small fragment nuclease isoform X2 [Anabas testudineus]